MKKKQVIGSVSSGTMRPEDLIPAFCQTLRYLRGSLPLALRKDERKFDARANTADGERLLSEEDQQELVSELFDALQEFAPPYFYFGAHPGDGADYGFWLFEDMQQEFDGLQVSDTSEVPADYRGEVLHINDHGNLTLYGTRANGTLFEVWSVV